ncbi:DUF3137 domain-containing protein [Planctomycetota bacterium]
MKTLDELRQFYQQELMPDLRALEAQRLQVARKVVLIGGGLVGTAALVGGVLALQMGSPVPLFFCLIPAGLLAGYVCKSIMKGYRGQFKGQVIGKLVHFIDEGLSYAPFEGVSQQTFKMSTLFKHHIDRYRAEDQVHGTVGSTTMGFSEVHAEYKTHDKNGDHWHTIFKGLFFVADFNKHFHGRTVVLPDTAERLFGSLGKMFQKWNFSRDQLIQLEDPQFEKEFAAYSTDQVEARYILSTSLMERILHFKRKTGKRIHIAFVRSYVFVAIPYKKNLFEPKLFTSLLNFSPIAEYVSDLQLGVGVVEDLNLNTRIWSKK